MKIAIIGPTHPYKGGIAQHTTELAHRLAGAGNDVQLVSWKSQFPFFYPGVQFVDASKPELPLFADTSQRLSWKNPFSWWRQARRLRAADLIILIWWVPTIQGPVYLTMLRALGKKRPPVTIICHNVLAHEGRPGDRLLTSAVLSRTDKIITHTAAQSEIVNQLVSRTAPVVKLPPALPGNPPMRQENAPKIKHKLLFFGLVRPYKGLDILLKALAQIADIQLIVAGEFWQKNVYDELVKQLGLENRVEMRKGYVPAADLAALFASADAMVLPYTSGSGSFNVQLAQAYGLPVIATNIEALASQVRNGLDGILCQTNDIAALTGAIKLFYSPGIAQKLYAGLPENDFNADWAAYLKAITES